MENAGVLPLEMELRKEIAALQEQLRASADEHEQQRLRRELNDKSLKYHLLMEKNLRRARRDEY